MIEGFLMLYEGLKHVYISKHCQHILFYGSVTFKDLKVLQIHTLPCRTILKNIIFRSRNVDALKAFPSIKPVSCRK